MNRKRIKVVHVITELAAGGAETLLADTLPCFDRQLLDVMVCSIYGDQNELNARRLREKGIKVIALKWWNKYDPLVVLKLATILRRSEVDVVHTHLFHGNLYGRVAARMVGVPVIISSEHSAYFWRQRRTLRDVLIVKVDGLLARFNDKVVAVSELVRNQILESGAIPEHKVTVIRNGIDLGRVRAKRDKAEIRNSLGIDIDRKLIGTVGRLHPDKGHAVFLKAARMLIGQRPDVQFLIIGDGPERRELQRLSQALGLEKKVLFLGYREDVADIISVLDLFVLPSLREGIPLALLEAMAAGKPVVATRVGGVPEVVKSGVTGLLISPDNPEELSDAMALLITDERYSCSMGQAAQEWVTREFDAHHMAERTQNLYEDLLREKSSQYRQATYP